MARPMKKPATNRKVVPLKNTVASWLALDTPSRGSMTIGWCWCWCLVLGVGVLGWCAGVADGMVCGDVVVAWLMLDA